jgi:iduronate 2-sulfatase
VSVPVEFIDIFPTLAQMCGVDAPVELSGKNLNDLDSKKEYYAFSQFPRPYAALHRAKARTHMGYTVRDSRWRYVEWYDNDGNLAETELYDLSQTELETENLSGSPACSLDEVRLKSALAKLSKNANFTAK